MASRELNILVAAKGALAAARDIGKVDKATSNLSRTAGRVGKGLAIGIGAGAAIGAAVIGKSVKSGLENLALLENAETQVTGALAASDQAFGVNAQTISGWANEIEASIQAAFDDKDITSATATLIRFGRVTPANLKPAMQVMTDLAARTGSVDSAATALAKAMADPTKAAGVLKRAGVILTKAEQEQIKTLVKHNKLTEAQAFLLDKVATATKGAAAASVGPYQDSLNVLNDVTEDAQKALAVGFLPVITKVRDILTRELAKPGTLKAIEDFGRGLAGGLEKLIDVAMGLPWDSIGSTFQVIGTGSKAMLDAFLGLPPWVQTAVLTAWGTNKITGGLVTSLASGLIKGVLGMNAGVVNINAGVVNGGGGGSGGVPVPGGGKFNPLSLIPLVAVAGVEIAVADALKQPLRDALNLKTDAQGLTIPEDRQVGPLTVRVGESPGMEHERLRREYDAAHTKDAGNYLKKTGAERESDAALANVRASERTERALSGPVVRELQAVSRITSSTAPSQKSAEAHLAQIKALQQTEAGRASGDAEALRGVLSRLEAAIARGFNVQVSSSAADNSRANADRNRTVKPHGPRHAIGSGPLP